MDDGFGSLVDLGCFHRLGQEFADHLGFAALRFGQIEPAGLFIRLGTFLALFDQLLEDGHDFPVLAASAAVFRARRNIAVLYRRRDQAQRRQTRLFPGLEGGFHFIGDTITKRHGSIGPFWVRFGNPS